MATNKEYLNFIPDQLSELDGITHRQMMGEYIIYYHGKLLPTYAMIGCWSNLWHLR